MAAAEPLSEAVVDIRARLDHLEGDLRRGRAATLVAARDMESSFARVNRGIAPLRASLGGIIAFLSGGVLARGISAAVRASVEQEEANTRLEASLRAVGSATPVAAITALSSALQRQTRFSDEAITGAQALLVQFGRLEGETLERATRGVLGLAAATGKDLNSAALLVAKSLGGSTNILARWGIQIEEGLAPLERQEAILRRLDPLFGHATAQALTFGGAMARAGNASDELLEGLGGILTKGPGATRVLESLTAGLFELADAFGQVQTKDFAASIVDLDKNIADLEARVAKLKKAGPIERALRFEFPSAEGQLAAEQKARGRLQQQLSERGDLAPAIAEAQREQSRVRAELRKLEAEATQERRRGIPALSPQARFQTQRADRRRELEAELRDVTAQRTALEKARETRRTTVGTGIREPAPGASAEKRRAAESTIAKLEEAAFQRQGRLIEAVERRYAEERASVEASIHDKAQQRKAIDLLGDAELAEIIKVRERIDLESEQARVATRALGLREAARTERRPEQRVRFLREAAELEARVEIQAVRQSEDTEEVRSAKILEIRERLRAEIGGLTRLTADEEIAQHDRVIAKVRETVDRRVEAERELQAAQQGQTRDRAERIRDPRARIAALRAAADEERRVQEQLIRDSITDQKEQDARIETLKIQHQSRLEAIATDEAERIREGLRGIASVASEEFRAMVREGELSFDRLGRAFLSLFIDRVIRGLEESLVDAVADATTKALQAASASAGAGGKGKGGGAGFFTSILPALLKVIGLQQGGVVRHPTLALIGEARTEPAEAVLSLQRARRAVRAAEAESQPPALQGFLRELGIPELDPGGRLGAARAQRLATPAAAERLGPPRIPKDREIARRPTLARLGVREPQLVLPLARARRAAQRAARASPSGARTMRVLLEKLGIPELRSAEITARASATPRSAALERSERARSRLIGEAARDSTTRERIVRTLDSRETRDFQARRRLLGEQTQDRRESSEQARRRLLSEETRSVRNVREAEAPLTRTRAAAREAERASAPRVALVRDLGLPARRVEPASTGARAGAPPRAALSLHERQERLTRVLTSRSHEERTARTLQEQESRQRSTREDRTLRFLTERARSEQSEELRRRERRESASLIATRALRIPVLDSGAIVNAPTLAQLARNNRPEAVIPLDQLRASMEASMEVNIINQTGEPARTSRRRRPGGGTTLDVVIAGAVLRDLGSNGPISQAMTRRGLPQGSGGR